MKASPKEAPKATKKATPKATPKAMKAVKATPKAAPKDMKAVKATPKAATQEHHNNRHHPDIPETCQCSTADKEEMLREKDLKKIPGSNFFCFRARSMRNFKDVWCHWCMKKLDLYTLNLHTLSMVPMNAATARLFAPKSTMKAMKAMKATAKKTPNKAMKEMKAMKAMKAVLGACGVCGGPRSEALASIYSDGVADQCNCCWNNGEVEQADPAYLDALAEDSNHPSGDAGALDEYAKGMAKGKFYGFKMKAMKEMNAMKATAKKKIPKVMKEMKAMKAATRKTPEAMKTTKTMKTPNAWMQIFVEPMYMSKSSKLIGEISTFRVKATDTINSLKWKILHHYTILPLNFDFVLLYKYQGAKGKELDFWRHLLDYGIRDGDAIQMMWGPEGDAAIARLWGESEPEAEQSGEDWDIHSDLDSTSSSSSDRDASAAAAPATERLRMLNRAVAAIDNKAECAGRVEAAAEEAGTVLGKGRNKSTDGLMMRRS